ncbi:MAG: hypothetical protein H7Y42_05320 [Chitinophagaceae bacterium]|nr:hypothetical protein [Chitinophagaceae bacterium]
MQKLPIFLLLALFLPTSILLGQAQTLDEKREQLTNGILDDNFIYACKLIGWKLEVNSSWPFMTKSEKERVTERGKQVIEETQQITIDDSGLKELLNLRKDMFNSFLSTIEYYDSTALGNWHKHNAELNNLIINTFKDKNIEFTHLEGKKTIDGLTLNTLDVVLYKPGTKDVLMYLTMYTRLINNYDFGMTITYNNDSDKAQLLKMVNQSTFSIRR